jgi:hypothetical protein
LRFSICEATAVLRSPTLDTPVAATEAGWGDAAGEGVAARGLATSGARAASLALALGFGGEAGEPGEERKLMLRSAGENPGDDDTGEEPTTARLRVRGAGDGDSDGDASGERKEGSGFGLGLGLALDLGFGLGFGGEAEPGEERKLMLRSAGEEPGDDDTGEGPPRRVAPLRVRVRVRGVADGVASGERKEEPSFVLGLRLGLEVVAAAVARGLPMAPLPPVGGWPLRFASLSRFELVGSTEREAGAGSGWGRRGSEAVRTGSPHAFLRGHMSSIQARIHAAMPGVECCI